MNGPPQINDWRPAYVALRQAGMKDGEIGALAGVSRAVINAVANGTYHCEHRLDFNGGVRVINKLKEFIKNGQLSNVVLDALRTGAASTERPAGK